MAVYRLMKAWEHLQATEHPDFFLPQTESDGSEQSALKRDDIRELDVKIPSVQNIRYNFQKLSVMGMKSCDLNI